MILDSLMVRLFSWSRTKGCIALGPVLVRLFCCSWTKDYIALAQFLVLLLPFFFGGGAKAIALAHFMVSVFSDLETKGYSLSSILVSLKLNSIQGPKDFFTSFIRDKVYNLDWSDCSPSCLMNKVYSFGSFSCLTFSF